MAGGDARLAAGAFVQVHFKRVLLAAGWFREWDQVTIIAALERNFRAFMLLGETRNGGERALLID